MIFMQSSKEFTFTFTPNSFIKMHGTGNCFLLLRHFNRPDQYFKKLSEKLCDYNFGIGADGVLVIADVQHFQNQNQHEQSHQSTSQIKRPKYYMKIYNKDGSKANMCGNGLRCFCACLKQYGFQTNNQFTVKTDDGIKHAKVFKCQKGYRVSIQMGSIDSSTNVQNSSDKIKQIVPSLQFKSAQFINFNVPHSVIYVQHMPTSQQISQFSKLLQNHMNSNINFVKVLTDQQSKSEIYVRTFERGAGLTLACGSGSCASALIGVHSHRLKCSMLEQDNKQNGSSVVKVNTEGGILVITVNTQFNENGTYSKTVIMDGPAQFICTGNFCQ